MDFQPDVSITSAAWLETERQRWGRKRKGRERGREGQREKSQKERRKE